MKFQSNYKMYFLISIGVFLISCLGLLFTDWSVKSQASIVLLDEIETTHPFSIQATRLIGENRIDDKSIDLRLNRYDIKNAIIPAFECRDLKMEIKPILTIGEMQIPLEVYDPNHKIGFVWLDYHVFGEGILDDKIAKFKTQKEAEKIFRGEVDKGIELYLENEEKFLLEIFGENPSKEDSNHETVEIVGEPDEMFKDFFERIKTPTIKAPRFSISRKYNETSKKWDFFTEAYDQKEFMYNFGQEIQIKMAELKQYDDQKEYLEIMFCAFKKDIFISHLGSKSEKSVFDEWALSAAEMIDDPVRYFGFIQRIKYLGFSGSKKYLSKALDEEILKISTTKDKKKWLKHSEALIGLMQANKTPVINSRKEYDVLLTDIITNYPYNKWVDHYYKIDDLSNRLTISKSELEALPQLVISHGICLAPLSILDSRTIYDMKEDAYLNQLKEIREEIQKAKNKEDRKSLQKELMDLTQYRSTHYGAIRSKAKSESIQAITADIEIFLDWAFDFSEEWKSKQGV